MPDTGRLPDLATLTRGELQCTRRDLAAALTLARPGSTARLLIGTHLAAIDAELATRVSQHSQLPAAAPGIGAGPDLEEVRGPWNSHAPAHGPGPASRTANYRLRL